MAAKPGRAQVLVALLLAALGFAAAVQIRLTHSNNDFAGQRREDLVVLLDSLSSATDRAQSQLSDLEQTRRQLQSSSASRTAAIAEERKHIQVLQILAGTLPAAGPGVTISITDPDGTITAAVLLNGIEELRDAGAEAIQINGSVRVVASTAVTDAGGPIVAGGVKLSPPYVVEAIGSSHTLSEAVVFPGGLADEVKSLGGTVTVHEAADVDVTALHKVTPPEYSHPVTN
ncbi:MAG: DUF881 domain-containing protein [Nocardioidaceae bacterium]